MRGLLLAPLAFACASPAQAGPAPFVVKLAFPAPPFGQPMFALSDAQPFDVDGDGVAELPRGGSAISVGIPGSILGYVKLDGNGSWTDVSLGTMTLPWTLPAYSLVWQPMAFADVDNDGDLDMYVAHWKITSSGASSFPHMLWLNDGHGGFRDSRHFLPPANIAPLAEFCDIDHDGDQDLILSGGLTPTLLIYVNDGTGHFTDESTRRIRGFQAAVPRYFCVIDADQDGDDDLLVDDQYQQMVLYVNDGHGRFSGVQQGFVRNSARGPIAVDADGDGWKDILMLQPQELYLSQPGMTTLLPARHLLPTMAASFVGRNAQVADFDNDGDLDVVGESSTTVGVILFWENTGSGFVDRSATMPSFPVTGNYAGFLADFDLDGDLDVAFGQSGNGAQYMLSNTYREAVTVTPPMRGGPYTVNFYAQPNHLMLVAFGIGSGNVGLPGLGRWYLNPATSSFAGSLSFPTRSVQPLTLAIPNIPAAQGLQVAMQGLDIDLGTGAAQTTNAPFSTIQ